MSGSIFRTAVDVLREDGLRELSRHTRRRVYDDVVRTPGIFSYGEFDIGDNVFNEEWDLLVVLDTCRPDALRSVGEEYDFVGDVSSKWSVGGDSWEWMANTFDERYIDEIRDTAYISSNPMSVTVLENQFERNHNGEQIQLPKVRRLKRWGNDDTVHSSRLAHYESLYDTGLEYAHGFYPSPRGVTDHAITADRDGDYDRMILHYMPPHGPYVTRRLPEEEREDGNQTEIVEEVRETSFDAYLDNLRWALDEVSLLLSNVDRENVVITADHGERFGRCIYDHVSGSMHSDIRRVPWARTEATDTGEYQPESKTNTAEEEREEPDDLLKSLGYKM